MHVIYGNKFASNINKPTGVGLGNFDGLHVGHMTLIKRTINESQSNGLSSMVYTFSVHPENVLKKERFTPLLTTMKKKIDLLDQTTQLDYIYFDEFDKKFSTLTPEEFVVQILVEKLGVKLAVAGYNYSFGYKGQGDVNFLKEMGQKYNFKVIEIPPVMVGEEVVSSTLIRNYIAMGDMKKASKLLGRHYSITGTVVTGNKIGSKIGFPTANILPEDYLLLPGHGVYTTRTKLEGQFYRSITNIGINPTIKEEKQIKIETHILNFNKDIYGRDIEVFFLEKLRNELKFKDIDELSAQIAVDIQRAQSY